LHVCVCLCVCVSAGYVLSYLTLTYSHSFSSFLPFLVIQARAVSGNTSTASEEVRYVRVGERRVKEKDSGTIAHCATPCNSFFLPLWLHTLLFYSTPFLPCYSHIFLPLHQSPFIILFLYPLCLSTFSLTHSLTSLSLSLSFSHS
jgi:hypothetical protein